MAITNVTYTSEEIDEKLEDIKNTLLNKISKTITMSEGAAPPSAGHTQLWLNITKTEESKKL